MKTAITSILISSFLTTLFLMVSFRSAFAQSVKVETIMNNLLSNPPNTGDPLVRKQNILAFDSILIQDSARTANSILNLYAFMMEKVKTELESKVYEGAAIWMMYNDGFIVKTPEIVFAFDVVQGYSAWQTKLPSELIDQIQILFISHEHSDHADPFVINKVITNGGYVVVPSEVSNLGNISMAVNDSCTLEGLRIKAYYGLHNVPSRIYEIICPSGLKLLHTGDNQTSITLPEIENLDVLLLNAWVNESGSQPASVGMCNSVNKLSPRIMIPGHIQELSHNYVPSDPTSRLPYQSVYQIDDSSVLAKTQVMIWGELYRIFENSTLTVEKNIQTIQKDFRLYQNYANPFNLSTTIPFYLPEHSYVSLKVFDLSGRNVTTIISDELSAGFHLQQWNAEGFTDGIYFYRLQADSYIETKKLFLVR